MNLTKERVEYYTDQGINTLDVAEKLKVKFSVLHKFMKENGIVKKEQPPIAKIPKMSASTIHDSRTVTLEDIKKGLGLCK